VETLRDRAPLAQITTLFEVGSVAGLSDASLLERFLAGKPTAAELAFRALVERHGPMVLRVCRRVLGNSHDAQDAFQATFLILARRAGSVRNRDSLASWLYGIAVRVSCFERKSAAQRRTHEQSHARGRPEAAMPAREETADLGPVVHQELARLPEKYRKPVVLCYFEGQTCEEAACRLGWPIGTVKSRLARARTRLKARLALSGLGASSLVSVLTHERVSAAVPALLVDRTVRVTAGAGEAVAGGVVPPAVGKLAQGVFKLMARDLLRSASIAVLLLCGGLVGALSLARPMTQAEPRASLPRESAKSVLDDYVVEPPDLILIEVLEALPGRPIQGERLVRPDGSVTLGYYGDLYVAGLTLKEIKAKSIAQLRKHLSDGQLGLVQDDPRRPGHEMAIAPEDSTRVRVDVLAYNSKCYYVAGEVQAPGRLPITGNETILDAINQCGGISSVADRDHIRLVRPALPGSHSAQILAIDLDAILNAGDTTTNYQLRPGDRLIVPRDAKATREEPGQDVRALARRLDTIEHRLDRVIELLEASQAPRPSSPH
jgi:RNA polymerase sigma factor (sigma-70 family)